jgi:hypothetical protein
MSGQGQTKTGDKSILADTANTHNILCCKVLPRLGDNVVELNDLPKGNKIERMFKIFCALCVKFAKQTGSVELAECLYLLNGSDLVVKVSRIVNALKSF